jgi:arylsulfatase A-like enzyme
MNKVFAIRWQRYLPIFLILMGAGVIAVALAADLVGIGDSVSLGPKQITLILAGFALVLGGLVLATPAGRRYLLKWQARVKLNTRPAGLLLIAIWFGLLTGWGETLVVLIRKLGGRAIQMGIEFLWLVPLANLLLFIMVGLILSLIAWRWPKLMSLRTATFIFAFLALLSGLLLLFSRLDKWAVVLLATGLALQIARVVGKHSNAFHGFVRYTVGWPAILRNSSRRTVRPEGSKAAAAGFQPGRRDFLIGSGAAIVGMAVGLRGWQLLAERHTLSRLPAASQRVPNVLLIVMDTVRAQSLSLYGYHRPTTPQIERLAEAGVRFDRAIATSPWTLPSHASFFTGHFPHKLSTGWSASLDATYPTLAEVLGAHGYVTAGFAANLLYCSRHFGLSRGFVHYEDFPVSLGQTVLSSTISRTVAVSIAKRREYIRRVNAEQLNRHFLKWLSNDRGGKPFFAFLNYYDAHDPFLPPAEFALKFSSKRRPVRQWDIDVELSDAEIRELNDAYDASIAYLDHHIGLLLDKLETLGILENTLVIITSDHGEHFGEHGLMHHGTSLYLPLLHVPLLVSYRPLVPAGESVQTSVSLRDLPATVVDLVGVGQTGVFPGNSLRRYWTSASEAATSSPGVLLSEVRQNRAWPSQYPVAIGSMKSLVIEGKHYIKNYGDGREELYDIEQDPAETQDLSGSDEGRQLLKQLRMSLDTVLARKQMSNR